MSKLCPPGTTVALQTKSRQDAAFFWSSIECTSTYVNAGAEEDIDEDLEEAQGLGGNNDCTDGTKDGDSGSIAV